MCHVRGHLGVVVFVSKRTAFLDIANFIYENTTTSTLDLDLQGAWLSDREFFQVQTQSNTSSMASTQLPLAGTLSKKRFRPSPSSTNMNMFSPSSWSFCCPPADLH